MQSGIEDTLYARGINRIRYFYVEVAPLVADYFILSTHDDAAGVLVDTALGGTSRWQLFRTIAGMLAVINSVLGGAFAGLLVAALVAPSLALATGVGLAAFLLGVVVHQRYQLAAYQHDDGQHHTLFPSPPRAQ